MLTGPPPKFHGTRDILNGETYRVLFGAATPQGVNPATIAQGQQTTGKLYFDVTGAEPDSVVYNAGLSVTDAGVCKAVTHVGLVLGDSRR